MGSTTRQAIDMRVHALAERTRSAASGGQEYVRDVAARIRERLEGPTRAEFEALKHTVERLEGRAQPTSAAPSIDALTHAAEEATGT
jgi:hypothetical protein